MRWQSSWRHFQADGFGEAALKFVEGEENLRARFEGDGDVPPVIRGRLFVLVHGGSFYPVRPPLIVRQTGAGASVRSLTRWTLSRTLQALTARRAPSFFCRTFAGNPFENSPPCEKRAGETVVTDFSMKPITAHCVLRRTAADVRLAALVAAGAFWFSTPPAFGVGAGVSAEQKQKEMEEEVTRAANAPKADLTKLQCGNLVYAGTKSSICFADKFLSDVAEKTNLNVGKNFVPVRLEADNVFDFPFCVWSGEADFSLTKKERENLRKYLLNGGFILSSPGCSDPGWDTALRKELKLIFPEYKMVKLPMSHPVFSTVNQVTRLTDKHGGQAFVEGMEVNGRLVMVYSKDGLNDVSNAKGCCCCGGNMIVEAVLVNVNVFTYALLY